MEFTYTSGWDEFENYCGKLFRGYLKRYCQGKEYKDEIKQAYVTEMSFIQKKVNENKEILKQLWVAAFVGNLSRKNDLTVTVRTHSCTLILSLFNLLPYGVMMAGCTGYPYTKISLTEYEVGELFYNTGKREIEAFFCDSGYEILWLGPADKDRNEIQPMGIVVLPQNKTKLDYIKNCRKLKDGSIGLIEETTTAYNETEESGVEIYYFRPTPRTTKLDMDVCEGLKIEKTENFVCSWEEIIETGFMTPEEEVRFQYLKPDNEHEMTEILALCMADVVYPGLKDENILTSVYPFTREDVFMYLIGTSMSEKNACYWTEVIRKGQFADKYEKGNNKNEADYFNDSEIEMFKAVKYLPSEISVSTTYELYKRCAVQNKIAKKRDSERQKERYGYSCN